MEGLVSDKKYQPYEMLEILQKQLSGGYVVFELGNIFFKVVLDLCKEFPKVWYYKKPEEKEIRGVKYINVEGYTREYDDMWILSTLETREHFLCDGWIQGKDE